VLKRPKFDGRTSALAAWASIRGVSTRRFSCQAFGAAIECVAHHAIGRRPVVAIQELGANTVATWVIDLIEDAHGLRPRPVGGIDVARAVVDAAEMFERVGLVEPVG